MIDSRPSTLPQFANQTMSFLSQLLRVDTMALYTVEAGTTEARFELLNVPTMFYNDYVAHGKHIDPFTPQKAARYSGAMALVSAHLSDCDRDKEFDCFLKDHGFVDTLEIFLKPKGTLVAGVSILTEKPWNSPEKRNELYQTCQIAQPYLEFCFQKFCGNTKSICISEWLTSSIKLSKREAEVARLVAEGKCNKRIAQELFVGVATVKTHLVRIFDKAAVCSRAELIAKINHLS